MGIVLTALVDRIFREPELDDTTIEHKIDTQICCSRQRGSVRTTWSAFGRNVFELRAGETAGHLAQPAAVRYAAQNRLGLIRPDSGSVYLSGRNRT